jgi:recombinational DNA repair protein RecT
MAKRDAEVKEVNAQVIFEGDEFVFEVDTTTGRQKLVRHVPSFDNVDIAKIRGAYAVVLFNDGTTSLTVMTLPQIKRSWMQGAATGNSPAHTGFTDEMCKKTVINRATKGLIGSADDSELPEGEDKGIQTREKNTKDKGGKKELSTHNVDFEDVTHANPTEAVRAAEIKTGATVGAESGTAGANVNEQTGEVTESGPGY